MPWAAQSLSCRKVEKIIELVRPSEPEELQIAVEGGETLYRECELKIREEEPRGAS